MKTIIQLVFCLFFIAAGTVYASNSDTDFTKTAFKNMTLKLKAPALAEKLIPVNEPPCVCDSLHPTFSSVINECTGEFTSTLVVPECMNTGYPVAYTWLVNGSFAGAGSTLTYSFPGNGNYTVCMIVYVMLPDGETCIKYLCSSVKVDNCCVCDALQPAFSTSLDQCSGVFETNTEIPACMEVWANPAYEWTVNGTTVSTSPNLVYTFPGSGTYTVCFKITTLLPDGNDCVKEVCEEVTVTCINSLVPQKIETGSRSGQESLLLYPNPASNELNIELELEEAGEVIIILRSTDGKIVLTEKRSAQSGRQQFNMKLPASVSNSTIFLELTAGTEKISRIVTVSKR